MSISKFGRAIFLGLSVCRKRPIRHLLVVHLEAFSDILVILSEKLVQFIRPVFSDVLIKFKVAKAPQ